MTSGTKKNRFIPGRSFFLMTICTVACVAIAVRLFVLQIVSYDKYQSQVIDNIQAESLVAAARGSIYDRNMTKIAGNETVYRVFVSPRDIEGPMISELSSGLAEILGITSDEIYTNIEKNKNKADRTIKRNVSEETADLIRAFIAEKSFSRQVHLEPSLKRYYPYGSMASHVLGFVGTDGGLLGLELYYNTEMTGVPGRYISAKDARGRSLATKYETYIPATDGGNLVTTIDVTLQRILERVLEETYVESAAANRVVGIAMDVETGGIYACGTYPDFDLNSPYVLDQYSQIALDALMLDPSSVEYGEKYMEMCYKMWNNKAVSDLYEPGSTFKAITSAAALEEKVISWTDEFNCPGYYIVAGRRISCHKTNGHGRVPYSRGLQQSCNPALMQVVERLGRDAFYKYFQAFNYTEKTGVDLPGEASPIFHDFSGFNTVEMAVYSFGQTFKVTPLQQLTAISTIANGGYLMTPHFMDSFVDNDGNILSSYETSVKRQVISTEICRQVTAVLEEGVATDGGARNAYVPGYKIAAKTGTSEVTDIRNEEGRTYLRVGSCVGYAPADDPKIAVIIIVDQPQVDNIYGSYVAAPYVSNFLSQALPYLGVERKYSEDELKNLSTTLRNYVGLTVAEVTKDLTNREISFKVEGSGDKVTYQIPAGGSTINKSNGKVILYTGDAKPDEHVTVPDVVGRSAFQANAAIVNAGLNILLEGATGGNDAVVVSQFPAAGESVEYGTVVTVTLRYIGDSDATVIDG